MILFCIRKYLQAKNKENLPFDILLLKQFFPFFNNKLVVTKVTKIVNSIINNKWKRRDQIISANFLFPLFVTGTRFLPFLTAEGCKPAVLVEITKDFFFLFFFFFFFFRTFLIKCLISKISMFLKFPMYPKSPKCSKWPKM